MNKEENYKKTTILVKNFTVNAIPERVPDSIEKKLALVYFDSFITVIPWKSSALK